MKKKHLLQQTGAVWFFAMVCCFLWGSAFPCIKIGYALFGIDSADTASQILFAGLRFTLAGVLVVLFYSIMQRKTDAAEEIGLGHDRDDQYVSDGSAVFLFLCRPCAYYRCQRLDHRGCQCLYGDYLCQPDLSSGEDRSSPRLSAALSVLPA